MWKKLPYPTPFFLCFTKRNGYTIYITDYINVWWVSYSENDFLTTLKKSNDDIEMENEEQLVQLGFIMLKDPEKLKKVHLTLEDKTLNVSVSLLCGFLIYLDMKLVQGSREMFFEKVTQPLLKTVQDLKMSESELRLSLIRKDKEIEEYKSETDIKLASSNQPTQRLSLRFKDVGARKLQIHDATSLVLTLINDFCNQTLNKITILYEVGCRNHGLSVHLTSVYLKTTTFNDDEHMKKHSLYIKNFGTLDIPSGLLHRIVNKSEDQIIVKEENQQIEGNRMEIKSEFGSNIKTEQSHVPETLNQESAVNIETVKGEIKMEHQDVIPKKKVRKMLKI